MPQHAVEVSDLSHRYGERLALDNIRLSVEAGTSFALLGPNGGGKTTLFRILSTLLSPTTGSSRVLGLDVLEKARRVRSKVGVIFQDVALDNELTVSENLSAHAALHGLETVVLRRRLDDLLPLLDIVDRANDRVGILSGGLKRRVDLVRSLLHTPPVLLLDEPTSGLDPAARQVFWEVVERLQRREKLTVLVATHVMEEADRCDRLSIIDRGRIVADGTPSELKASLGSETLWIDSDDAASLIGDIRSEFGVRARVIGSRIQISDPAAHELLSSLYESRGDRIRSATVRRPTLEDVFMVFAGHDIQADERAEQGARQS